ncbi:HAD family phosphatase [uncultured Bifidobacterium sp.]|uniref:HAD family hydrolase n=1 Tax=uncultured Bifidobacterium sp. TaxID=165187 RepID=UPI00262AAD99|nr:HAD family phosphatase [uncultured Bifidobacterium sp.]
MPERTSSIPLSVESRSPAEPSTPTDVIFDFCGVLLDWRCDACLRGHWPDSLVERICADDDPYGFFEYEARMDQGQPYTRALADYAIEYGGDMAKVFDYYIAHYADSLTRIVPGMETLLRDLIHAGVGVWGLTNWASETFPVAFEKFPVLETLLQGTVVSGREHVFKPHRSIYDLTVNRFGLARERCLFFDDTVRNVEGARAAGLMARVFTDSDSARLDLRGLGVDV